MKRLISLLMIAYIYQQCVFATPIHLTEAIKTKAVSAVIRYNPTGTHYTEPLLLELTNNSNSTVNISIENGDIFIPNETVRQNIVATKAYLFTLLPAQKKTSKIKGMCIEQNDAAGAASTLYTITKGKNDTLKKLATFIAEKNYQTSAAQFAVWAFIDRNDVNNIYSSDSAEENDLKKFIAKLTGKSYTIKSNDYTTNYYAPPKEKVGGNFEYNFSKTSDVQIAMFNKNGILVRELFNQKQVQPGIHKFNFAYDASVYTDDIYYFKLITNNEVFMSQKWNAGEMRERFKQRVLQRLENKN